jgi:hypothetical protein
LFLRTVRGAFLLFALFCAVGVPASMARGRLKREVAEIPTGKPAA